MQKLIASKLLMLVIASAFSQEYTYDGSGNLSRDENKQVSSIHYNYLNLVDTITYSDGRRVFYTYTGSGQKLRERTILSNGTVKQKRDYLGNVLYCNDTLRELQHEDGRSVPLVPGNTANWEYQYRLKDHLGNVRSMLTTKEDVNSNIATFETESGVEEENKFSGYYNTRRVNSILFDHTHKGTTHYAQRLNGSANEKYGLSKSLSVMPGDTIRLEVYGKYVDPNSNHWSTALAVLMSQVTNGAIGTVVDGAGYAASSNTPFPFAGLNGTSENKGAGPKAYLNWLVFDRNFVLKTGGYVKMNDVAKENGSNVPHEKLEKELVISQPGYVYVYLSNEETTPVEVYFDDFSVTQLNGPVIQESDYDPFGLTFNEYSRENAIPNNFLYNGKELQKDFDLNWYDYGARMYDAALGRWHVIDPMAEKYVGWSPYNYVMNNPVKFVDPDGREAKFSTILCDPSACAQIFAGRKNMPLALLLETVTGRGIASRVFQSKALSLVFFVNEEIWDPKFTKSGGVTVRSKDGKPNVKTDESTNTANVFGVDVTGYDEIRLTFIKVKDSKDPRVIEAEILGHEWGAHFKPVGKNTKENIEEREHAEYGVSGAGEYVIRKAKDGYHVELQSNSSSPRLGSTADKLQRELAAELERKLNSGAK